jgi:hypothetical protein
VTRYARTSEPGVPTVTIGMGPITLSETVDQWWGGIAAYMSAGINNAASEDGNRLIELEARYVFGFRSRVIPS